MGFTAVAHPTTRARTTVEPGRAIYMLTNGQENAVVALPIADNGLLFGGTRTPTGGEGSPLINATSNQPVDTDALASQSSVTIAGNVGAYPEEDPANRSSQAHVFVFRTFSPSILDRIPLPCLPST